MYQNNHNHNSIEDKSLHVDNLFRSRIKTIVLN